MAGSPNFDLKDHSLPEFTNFLLDQAARDADLVGTALGSLGIRASPDAPLLMPAAFLLHLAAALRLRIWDRFGYTFHREAGLSEGKLEILNALRSFHVPRSDAFEFYSLVTNLAVDHLAWNGRKDLGADVVVDELIDDEALGAIAEFLWANRHRDGK